MVRTMNRKDFLKFCALLGLGTPWLSAGAGSKRSALKPDEKVIVIGAGAAGLTAAYWLHQQGVDVEILEASEDIGGRMQRTLEFADFPIPLGAEWLHVKPTILQEIINDPEVDINIATKPYNYDVDYALVDGKRYSLKELGFKVEEKFINASWYDFFADYIAPVIANKIRFQQIVKAIDYSGEAVTVQTSNAEYKASRVIVTVPIKLLQGNAITFNPPLPEKKQTALNNLTVWNGCKIFIEFAEKFYPVAVGFGVEPYTAGEKLFYDAAYGQSSAQHILGIFSVGVVADAFSAMPDDELIGSILDELDTLFDGKATANYKKHLVQRWDRQPFAGAAYLSDYENWRDVRAMGKPVSDTLYFAGDGYTDGSDWGSVHAAARSAIAVVKSMVQT